ncbi:MAG: serine protease [Lachnospiraceae bacterium]|nr:serine protease [Lachnospiraceae bacterium]
MKIIAEDVTKEQEYLFFYFMTLLGCDVLLLENRKDAEIPQGLKSLSQQLLLGQFGTGKLPEYKPYTLKTERDAAKDSPANTGQDAKEGRRSNVRVTIPERNRHRNQVDTNIIQSAPQRTVVDSQPQQTPAASTVSQLRAGTVSAKQESSEKTFEELAQLASSIVMIAVHDSRQEVIGTGSGIMIGRAGFILTNDHVVSGGSFFSVRMEDDGQIYTTDEVIKYNYNLDLAVIRISKQLNPLPIYSGTRKLVRGQKVVAIGSPLGLFNSVSDGIISGFRDIRDVNMIQFTAPISPGSSGGAVLNMQGEVIGISTAGIDNGQNINLAVSYKDIRTFARGFY